MITVSAIPAFADNYIWALHDKRSAVIVDPGDAAPVLAFLKTHHLTLAAILITHHHADHAGGVAGLLAHTPVPVWGPAFESIAGVSNPVNEPATITLPALGLNMTVLDVPGHTAGHIAYYSAPWLFCGDTLFACGCGRLFEGTPEQMLHSLQKLAQLPGDTAIYCAHEYTLSNIAFAQNAEPNNEILRRRAIEAAKRRQQGLPTVPSRLDLEWATNPFLRCHEPDIGQAMATHTGTLPTDTVAVFAALRQWKNHF